MFLYAPFMTTLSDAASSRNAIETCQRCWIRMQTSLHSATTFGFIIVIMLLLHCSLVHPREFLFVVVDGLVARAPVASHQSTDEALRGRTG